ncbi:MAG: hypothetical protein JNM88_05840 [Chitinophagaceae bacterium]|nr:hypothetical protein [Chitinophagaceae bacterium]
MKPFIPSKVAEFVFSAVIAYFGYLHFKNADFMGGMVPDYFPGDGKIYIYLTGAGFVLAAIAIVANFQKALACYLLAAVLLIFVFAIHLDNFKSNPSGVLKDTALAMAAILIGNKK